MKTNESNIITLFQKNLSQDLSSRFISVRNLYVNELAKFSHGISHGFPDHGEEHVMRVMGITNELLEKQSFNNGNLTETEAFVLALSALLHDIGMNVSDKLTEDGVTDFEDTRKRHSDYSAKLVDEIFKDRIDPKSGILADIVKEIIVAHSSMYDIRLITEEEPYENEVIRTRYLAALLRLADELEIGFHRASEMTMKAMGNINEESKKHWSALQNIQAVKLESNGRIFIHTKRNISDEDLTNVYFTIIRKLGKELKYLSPILSRQGTTSHQLFLDDDKKLIENVTDMIECFESKAYPQNFIEGILLSILRDDILIKNFQENYSNIQWRGRKWTFIKHLHHSSADLTDTLIKNLKPDEGLIICTDQIKKTAKYGSKKILIIPPSDTPSEIRLKISQS